MIRHIKHAVHHAAHARGFIHKHPIVTFTLAAIGLATVGVGVKNTLAGKTPATSQPPAAGGAA